jgi:hypothetical protein
VYVNPLTEQKRLPPGAPVPDTQLAAFAAARDALSSQLAVPAPALASRAAPVATSAAR